MNQYLPCVEAALSGEVLFCPASYLCVASALAGDVGSLLFLSLLVCVILELASDKYIPRKIYELYKMEYCHGPQCSHKSSGSSDQQTEEHILTISHKCM